MIKTIVSGYEAPDIEEASEPLSATALVDKAVPIFEVDASGNDGNIAEGAVDGDFNTRWNGYGDPAWLAVGFNSEKEVAGVGISFFKGEQRKYYFDLQYSEDGETWETVAKDLESSGNAEPETLEMFMFTSPVKAKYFRYFGHGSSDNDANNIWEFVPVAP